MSTSGKLSRRLVLGVLAGGLVACQTRAANPAGPSDPGDRALDVEIDASAAPELQPWAEEVRLRAKSWWALINQALASPGYTPPRTLQLRLAKNLPPRLAAHVQGNTVFINAPYVDAHLGFYNFIAHEMVHVVQNYPRPIAWLVEGIADYVRYYVLFPQDLERFFNPDKTDYRRGYQPAALLLDWVERAYGLGTVRKLNAAMRQGENGEAYLTQLSGVPLDTMWVEVLTAYKNGSPVPRA